MAKVVKTLSIIQFTSTTTATNQNTGGSGAHNNIQPSIVKLSAIKYRPSTGSDSALPPASSIEGYWSSTPVGYLAEDGSAISRVTYSDLFATIGTTFGVGDGSTTFNLPDSRGRAAVNQSSDPEFAAIGQITGSKTETLTIAQIPSHTHIQNAHNHISGFAGVNVNGSYGVATTGGGNINTQSGTNTLYHALTSSTIATNQNTGGSGNHNNIQPSTVKLSAIKYTPAIIASANVTAATSLQGYWTVAPTGYLLENGSAVSRTTYAALFTAIGTTYGCW